MHTITRNIINDKFLATHLTSGLTFTKFELDEKIDLWKYFLKYKCQAKPQESIVIGNQTLDIDYFAIIFAAAELSLKIVIIDYIQSAQYKDINFIDSKTEALVPIDIFLHDVPAQILKDYKDDCLKIIYYCKVASRSYNINEQIDQTINLTDFNESKSIMPKPSDILIKATSSGTTGKPKLIEHTHEFIHAVSNRNKKLYKSGKTAVHVKNLNHGASAAVTLFPVLASDSVTNHLIYGIDEDDTLDEFVNLLSKYCDTVAYMSFPYPYLVDKFLSSSKQIGVVWKNLNLVTLSYILESARIAVKEKIIKRVISIFGSTETIGPVFTNIIDADTWDNDPRYFNQVDDFYDIQLSKEGKISITPPVYNTPTVTNDYFKKEGDYFVHQGRSDLVRINGEEINLSTINAINKANSDSYVVIDTLNHCLYIAFWTDLTHTEMNNFKQEVESHFKRVTVNKMTVLVKQSFYYGIKIDNELLREYFRNHID